uniref:Rx N-terminal domain-containing protein n=1 Tax=Fagus sylvatica TaxID=28930 RepID=A0A2N9H5Y6_FAGSY
MQSRLQHITVQVASKEFVEMVEQAYLLKKGSLHVIKNCPTECQARKHWYGKNPAVPVFGQKKKKSRYGFGTGRVGYGAKPKRRRFRLKTEALFSFSATPIDSHLFLCNPILSPLLSVSQSLTPPPVSSVLSPLLSVSHFLHRRCPRDCISLGVKDDLEKLKNTVSAIKAVLLDAEEKQVQSHAIKDWVGNLKDALYEADDVLDDFSTEALRREVMTRGKKDAINANRMEFHLVERVVETQVRSRIRETHYFVRAEDVIGREDDKKVIIERLLDSNIEENVSVLPIGGARGSRILVTTREMKVAETIQTVEPHVLRGLNEDQSWSLFKQMTFENGQEPENLNIKALGMKIIEKCKGVTLAINTIGSLLYGTNSEQEWLSFKDKELSKVGQDKNDILLTLRMRTFLLPNQTSWPSNQEVWKRSTCDAIVSSFKFLRQLDLKNTGISSVPCSIALKEFPRDFYKLVNLRHLVIDHCSQLSHMPRELEKLTNLRTLSRFVLIKKTGSVSELTRVLKELHGLRGKLEIPNLRHGKDGAIESNILKEKHLQKLRLRWLQEDVDEADIGYDEMSLKALQPHPNLKLPSLVDFPSLQYFSLTHLDSLENISEMEWQSLSRLSELILIALPNLVFILVGIQHITTLQRLSISGCPISLERCKRETGEDWPKIAHIPNLGRDLYGL